MQPKLMEFGLGGNVPKFEEEQLKPLTIGNKVKLYGQSSGSKNNSGLVNNANTNNINNGNNGNIGNNGNNGYNANNANNANNTQDSQMSLQKFYNYYMNRIKN